MSLPGVAAPARTLHQELRFGFSYRVCFTEGLFDADNATLADAIGDVTAGPRRVLALVDDGFAEHQPRSLEDLAAYARQHGDVMALAGEPLVVAGGERVKSDPAHLDAAHAAIERHGIDRHAYVLAIGGGAMLDMAGYAAATAHRGVRLVRVPTTVLAQNDAGVGVKNGVNAFGKKNFLGTFAPPWAVLNDAAFLSTLSDRDWRAGTIEAVKVALLKDPAFFELIERDAPSLAARARAPMSRLVERCAELHLDHITTGGDPFECGSSRPLDFGHWSAHRLEAMSGWSLKHGEAVAVGIALDSTYSRLAGHLDERSWLRILDTIGALGLPLAVPELATRGPGGGLAVLDGLEEFRQHLGGRLTVTLLTGIGQPIDAHEIDRQTMVRSISTLEDHARAGGHHWSP